MKTSIQDSLHGIYSLLILIMFVCIIYLSLIQPLLSERHENSERIESLTFQLNRFSNTSMKIDLMRDEIKQLKLQNSDTKGFLKNNTPAVVAADLQKKFKELIKSNGGNLVSTHVVKQKNQDIYQKITIKTHIKANIETLNNVLYKLTSNNPLLFTENIMIQKRTVNKKKSSQNNDLLEIRFDVSGFINNNSSSS
jgi:Type II secretion system (T2SS), protein M subtype b